MTPETFDAQLQYFKSHFTVLPLTDALSQLTSGTLPERALAITFDDGYRNFYTHAYPLLKKYTMTATVYLATDFVCRNVPLWVDRLEYSIGKHEGSYSELTVLDATTRATFKTLTPQRREHDLRNVEQIGWTKFEDFNDDRSVYAPLSSQEILELHAGGITFGAHTQSHPILATQTREEQFKEIDGSKRDITSLGIPVSPIFAYPNGQAGDWNDDTEAILKESGFTHALTTFEGTNTAQTAPYGLKRFALDATEDRAVFANVVSGVRLFLKSIL